MRFFAVSALLPSVDPVTGAVETEQETFAYMLETARRLEELGYDGFGIGERHHHPLLATAPPVVLGYVAGVTERITLFTGVTLLSLLDPVRVAEDYATLSHLAPGRLELIIGKGAGPQQAELFGLTFDAQRAAFQENYRLFHRLWHETDVTWSGSRRPPLHDVTTRPRPLEPLPRIWHGVSTSPDGVAFAAEFGDPVFFSNVTRSLGSYSELYDHYRATWDEFGHPPAGLRTGAGSEAMFVALTSQQAIDRFRPIYEYRVAWQRSFGSTQRFPPVEQFIEESSALVGSPQQIVEKVLAQHERLGLTTLCFNASPEGLTQKQHFDSLELFQSAVAPELRRVVPDPDVPEEPAVAAR